MFFYNDSPPRLKYSENSFVLKSWAFPWIKEYLQSMITWTIRVEKNIDWIPQSLSFNHMRLAPVLNKSIKILIFIYLNSHSFMISKYLNIDIEIEK